MAESHQDLQSTQPQDLSPSPADHARNQAESDQQKAQQAKDQAEAKNPFNKENMAKKRQAALDLLRKERNVPEPKERERAENRETSRASDAPHRAAEPDSKPADGPSPNGVKVEGISDAQNAWYQREQEVKAAEQRVKEAETRAEAKAAEAEKKVAEAKAAEERQRWARTNPIEFAESLGMTQEQWQELMANGGKLSPEQERIRGIEKQLKQVMEANEKLQRDQQEAVRRQAIQQEDQAFSSKLSDYTFVSQMGGLPMVRQKQHAMSQSLGSQVPLEEAAKVLEQEYREGLSGLLKHESIRTKLGLSDVDKSKPGPTAKPPSTLNNRTVSSTAATNAPSGKLAWNDWAGKRERALKLMREAEGG